MCNLVLGESIEIPTFLHLFIVCVCVGGICV
jgi:hypothetical protein